MLVGDWLLSRLGASVYPLVKWGGSPDPPLTGLRTLSLALSNLPLTTPIKFSVSGIRFFISMGSTWSFQTSFIFYSRLSSSSRISPPQRCWCFGLDNSLLWGAVLCAVGGWAASLVPTQEMPGAPSRLSQVVTTKNVSRYCQMSPGCQSPRRLRIAL